MKKLFPAKAVFLFLIVFASASHAVDCYGGSFGVECVLRNFGADCMQREKVRHYECKDGSEYRLICAEGGRDLWGQYYQEYVACSDVSKKEYLVKVGAKQTKFNPEEERIARKKSKEQFERETKKASQDLQTKKQVMNKAKQAGEKNREKNKKGVLVDSRDGKKYKTVQIGNQNWMAENLNYDYMVNGISYGSRCSEKDDSKCSKYGRLYNVGAVTDSAGIMGEDNHACFYRDSVFCPQGSSGRVIQGICPDGWHLPTETDWESLFALLTDTEYSQGKYGYEKKFPHLMSSDVEWDSVVTEYHENEYFPEYSWTTYHQVYYGTDDYGFSALKSGYYSGYEDKYHHPEYSESFTDFWLYMKDGTERSVLHSLGYDIMEKKYTRANKAWISLRCIENDALVSKKIAENRKKIDNMKAERARFIEKNGGSFIDKRDGNEYQTIRIGGLNWMAENLRYNRVCGYSDNSIVECISDDKEESEDRVGNKYSLKDAFAFASDGSVCPEGWHLPSVSEWKSLRASVGDWKKLYANNLYRYKFEYNDSYGFSMKKNEFWSSDYLPMKKMNETELYRWINKNRPTIITFDGKERIVYGADYVKNNPYIRCVQGASNSEKNIKRASTIADSLTKIRNKNIYENGGTFIDKRDGHEYRSIQIGDRIWMAENLKFENKKSSAHESHLGLNNICLENGEGCYYQWMLAQGRGLPGLAVEACPSGWRLPDTSDVNALFRTVGGSENAAKYLKQNGSWAKNGPDIYGFSAEHIPYPNEPSEKYGPYALWKNGVPFWTSTEVNGSFSYAAKDLVYTMFFENNGDGASVQTSPKGAYLPIRCVAISEKKSGIKWNDGKSQHENGSSNGIQEDDKIRMALAQKKIKHGPHAAILGGFPLMDGQPGYSGMNKINSLIEGEVGYKVGYNFPYVLVALGVNIGRTYINFTRNDKKENFGYYYLGIPVSVQYPFTEMFYVNVGVTYKRMLEFLGYPSYSEYIAMDGNVFLISAGVGVMIGRWDLGIVLGTEYLGDEKSNRGENFRNRYLNIGISADCWF